MSARNDSTAPALHPSDLTFGWLVGWTNAYLFYNVTPYQTAFAIGTLVGLTISVALTLRCPGWLVGWLLAWTVATVLYAGGQADVSPYDHVGAETSTPVLGSSSDPFVHECDLPDSACKPLPMSDEELFKFPR